MSKFNSKKTIQLEKWIRRPEETFCWKGYTDTQKHRKWCLRSLPIREMQTKITRRYYYTSIRMAEKFLNLFILIGRYLLYSVVLFSAKHQHESAIDIHMSGTSLLNLLPPATLSHPSRLSQSIGLSSQHHTANSHWLSILLEWLKIFK